MWFCNIYIPTTHINESEMSWKRWLLRPSCHQSTSRCASMTSCWVESQPTVQAQGQNGCDINGRWIIQNQQYDWILFYWYGLSCSKMWIHKVLNKVVIVVIINLESNECVHNMFVLINLTLANETPELSLFNGVGLNLVNIEGICSYILYQ